MEPFNNGGVFDDADRAALAKAGCTPPEVWALGIFAERFQKKERKHIVAIVAQAMEKSCTFTTIIDQWESTWSDIFAFGSEANDGTPEHPRYGAMNTWAFNNVRKALKLEPLQPTS